MDKALLPLAPDLHFKRLRDNTDAFELSFAVKKEALGPHIQERWTWDDDYQRDIHRARFAEKPFFAIMRDAETLGTLSWWICADHVRLGEFYLFARHQKQGLGTRILKHALAQSDAARLPVRLEHLKWNPVGSLYRRHGFRVTDETDIHYFLERSPV